MTTMESSTSSTENPLIIGDLMEHVAAVFQETATVGEVIDRLREIVRAEFVTYAFVTAQTGILSGVIVMRELLFNDRTTPVTDIMVKNPFSLSINDSLVSAMRAVLTKHFPVYPVCDEQGVLKGEVRGSRLFQEQAIELSAQPGSMVGIDKEERLFTAWPRSFKSRHPWLQLNLLTAFIAGGVVSFFQGTIDHLVILAAFLPVLAGQSGNTGCQALAVTLRGLTLGEVTPGVIGKIIAKEALLGFLNGFFVGLIAGGAMFFLARSENNPHAVMLGAIVLAAMVISCAVSGMAGSLVPLALKKMGADPATASSIFLTTATDVASMGLLLGLASALI